MLDKSPLLLSQAHWNMLLRRIRKRLINRDDAEDILQEAYLRFMERKADIAIANREAYLARSATNIAIDRMRHRRVRLGSGFIAVELNAVVDDQPLQDEILASRARLHQTREALDRLPKRTRVIFLKHRLNGMKYREIATELGISVSAVEKHIAKAIVALTRSAKD